MTYALCLLSPIPVVRVGDGFQTLDLWARDLAVQVHVLKSLTLVCPVLAAAPAKWKSLALIPLGISVVPLDKGLDIAAALAGSDVVQVSGNQGWWDARLPRRFVTAAHRLGLKAIVGISSNRARAALLNASTWNPRSRLVGLLKYLSIRLAQWHLTRISDGTFVVGEGLRHLVSGRCKAVHVSIASWVQVSNLDVAASQNHSGGAPLHRFCVAARLERMKGTHLALDAMALLVEANVCPNIELLILGEGPERAGLEAQIRTLGLDRRVTFGGVRTYPDEFFAELQRISWVLLTNLSDEQPRLVFDAISQGCLPICPKTRAYEALGLPEELLYTQGNSSHLATTIESLLTSSNISDLRAKVLALGHRFTLEAMHAARACWVQSEVVVSSS